MRETAIVIVVIDILVLIAAAIGSMNDYLNVTPSAVAAPSSPAASHDLTTPIICFILLIMNCFVLYYVAKRKS